MTDLEAVGTDRPHRLTSWTSDYANFKYIFGMYALHNHHFINNLEHPPNILSLLHPPKAHIRPLSRAPTTSSDTNPDPLMLTSDHFMNPLKPDHLANYPLTSPNPIM